MSGFGKVPTRQIEGSHARAAPGQNNGRHAMAAAEI
jgi:hypothetical protein